ncbi:MAG: hypothetical protein GY719_25870 [bacterium]|nr:hypothetical protein [bacterium]
MATAADTDGYQYNASQSAPFTPYTKPDGTTVFPAGSTVQFDGTVDHSTAAVRKLDGTTRTDSAADQAKLAALTASAAELNQYAVEVVITDISAAGSFFVVCPHAGDIAKIYTAIDNAITVGDATITAEIGGVAVTDSSITIAQSGSAAGDVDSSTPSAANTVTEGQAVEIITDGGSTDACRATCTLLITR